MSISLLRVFVELENLLELRTTSFIVSTGVVCFDSVSPMDLLKDVVRSSMKVPEFNKHLKKVGGHIGRNVVEIAIKMKTVVLKPLMIKIILLFNSFFFFRFFQSVIFFLLIFGLISIILFEQNYHRFVFLHIIYLFVFRDGILLYFLFNYCFIHSLHSALIFRMFFYMYYFLFISLISSSCCLPKERIDGRVSECSHHSPNDFK